MNPLPKKSLAMMKKQFFHFRTKENGSISCFGGATVCYLPSANGKYGTFGLSICSPNDMFRKIRGRGESESNAIHNEKTKNVEFRVCPMTMTEAHDFASKIVYSSVRRIMNRYSDKLKQRHSEETAHLRDQKKSMEKMVCITKSKKTGKVRTRCPKQTLKSIHDACLASVKV